MKTLIFVVAVLAAGGYLVNKQTGSDGGHWQAAWQQFTSGGADADKVIEALQTENARLLAALEELNTRTKDAAVEAPAESDTHDAGIADVANQIPESEPSNELAPLDDFAEQASRAESETSLAARRQAVSDLADRMALRAAK